MPSPQIELKSVVPTQVALKDAGLSRPGIV